MVQTKPKKQLNVDALFAETTERTMAEANKRLDARISRTTYQGDSPSVLEDMGWVFAETTERTMAEVNKRLDARISRTTYGGYSSRGSEDTGRAFDTSHDGSSDGPSEAKPED